MVFLLILTIGALVLFNTGMTVNKKVKLVNTADAAAYSAAVQQARAYNLMAYMNRAVVANEVAMAQLVSMYSWTNYLVNSIDHLQIALAPFVWLPPVTAIEEALTDVNETTRRFRRGEVRLFNAAASFIAIMNGVYSNASRFIAVASHADTANLARKIVHANDPDAHITAAGWGVLTAQVAAAYKTYLHRYKIPVRRGRKSRGGERLRNVVMEARDPFSRQRNYDLKVFGLGTVMTKRGGTDLAGYHNWVGFDTLNLHFCLGFCGFFGSGKEYNVPVSWGGAAGIDQRRFGRFSKIAKRDHGWNAPYAGDDPAYATQGHYDPYAGALDNSLAGDKVLSHPTEGGSAFIRPKHTPRFYRKLGATVGLPNYNDIAAGRATVPYDNDRSADENGVDTMDVGPVFTVVVGQPMRSVHTSDHLPHLGNNPASVSSGIFGGGADFRVPDKTLGNRLTALGSAQVYFSRSRHLFSSAVDPRREMGSLFSPYWQARRVDTPRSVRLGLAGAGVILPVAEP